MARLRYDPSALARLLGERGWTISDLTRRSRLKKMTVHQLVRRRNRPRADTLAALARAFEVSVNAFFIGDSKTQ